jgi:hypothetical protein
MSGNAKPMRSLRVFLCHSSGDKAIVRDLYRQLSSSGYDPWLDERNLLPGQRWEIEIPKAVRQSDIVLVCLSQASIAKPGYVQKEIKFALDVADEQPEGSIFVIPVRFEHCTIPDRLRNLQWVDFFKPTGYDDLLKSLRSKESKLDQQISADVSGVSEPLMLRTRKKRSALSTTGSANQRDPKIPDSLGQAIIQIIWRWNPVLRNILLIIAGSIAIIFLAWSALPEKLKADMLDKVKRHDQPSQPSSVPIPLPNSSLEPNSKNESSKEPSTAKNDEPPSIDSQAAMARGRSTGKPKMSSASVGGNSRRLSVAEYLARAERSFARKNYETAISVCRAGLRSYPSNGEIEEEMRQIEAVRLIHTGENKR